MSKEGTIQGDVSELAEKNPAHWLLAWYACGGYTKPASLLEEAVGAMAEAATCLNDFESVEDGEGFVVEEALDSAGKSGKVWRIGESVCLDGVVYRMVIRSEIFEHFSPTISKILCFVEMRLREPHDIDVMHRAGSGRRGLYAVHSSGMAAHLPSSSRSL